MTFACDLRDLTIAEARDALAAGNVSARELTEAHLAAIKGACDLNVFITETPDRALADADASDARRAAGEALGPLDGIPLAIKDLFCTDGVQTTAASHILEGFVPPYESTVTENLRNAGTIMLGKTNLDEFAMGSSNETSYFGKVENPWQREGDNRPLVPGGSSGGSASAVSGRLCLGATGTDTGGSIRQPAAFCGIVGMKPTYGRCSRWGIVAFASSLDQAGPMTRTVRDAAILLGGMAGFDPKDSTSAEMLTPDFEARLDSGVQGLRIGIPAEYAVDGMNPEIAALWDRGKEWLTDAGAELVDISLPHTKYALPAYYIIAPAEASSNLARYDGVRYGHREDGEDLTGLYENTRASGFGQEVRRRILIGTYALSSGYYDAYYLKAQKVRALIARDFHNAYKACDVILTPTTPGAAFAMGEKSDDPIAMYLNDVLTVPASLAGLPAISVPGGLSSEGLPLGLHLIGNAFDEQTLFRTAQALEYAAGFDTRPHRG
ncbi:MAG: Asp-tRNA(Asn)/Glu-tRNA(Gln) amidotransferase subunit GatA [Rhodospirillaceae bacterium]|nr:Asp-tRNA(Asn)/Glu-tRNA(Gln) amidotransferase GatCAB subunit A [Rhodospirillaceae bacterium]RPF95965.1 MAG: Asp-tRNA(Asn)/Glu-tRNA(Gln) amidotransferase subunit GatA [Rhodospirillaceae bacterium TMED63]RZO36292.1 MAG: Asp-tRNA(Asn)/Glu-tRNA(Gln) amidotransferase subunit GatA [Rhodospirillaceae bacterium]